MARHLNCAFKKGIAIFLVHIFLICGCSNNKKSTTTLNSTHFEECLCDIKTSNSTESCNDDETTDNDCESFIFFTDPHLFLPDNRFIDDNDWFVRNIPILKNAYNETKANFIMCGGDLLNSGDSYEEASFKLRMFSNEFNLNFDNFYTIVGNHDTNYLGDTYMAAHNMEDCVLSHQDIGNSLYGSEKTYYSFDLNNTRNYCFDSWIEDDNLVMDEYKWEQVLWFANDLLISNKAHSSIFIHIAFANSKGQLTSFMENIGNISNAYNNKESISINGNMFDYSNTAGQVSFIQSGHEHKDINIYNCFGIPIISTASYSFTTPTFDYIFVDYQEKILRCHRYGTGLDREFNILAN